MITKILSLELKIQPFFILRNIDSHFSPVLRAVAVLAALALTSSIAHAQADFEKGYQAFQSYHGSDFDTVNLANGNLVLDIPLLSYEQRGGLPPIVISIRSNSTTFQSTPPFSSGPADTQQHEVASGVIGAPWGQPHVSISPGGLYWKEERIVTAPKTAIGPEYLTRFVAYDDSGATHSLGGSIANQTAGYVANIKYSVDGSGLMLQPGTTATGPVLVDRKGNTGGLVDPNGNAITLQGSCATAPGSGDFFDASLPGWEGYAHGTASATTIVDSIGRVIPNPSYLKPVASYSCLVDVDASYHPASPDANGCETYNFPANNNGASLPITNGATVPLKFCYAQIPVSASIANPSGSSLEYETINELWWVLTSVTLPNQTTWQFAYDSYGQVSSVTTPTGATVSYTYQSRLACGNPPGTIPVTGTPVWPFTNLMSSREVNNRTLAVAGDLPALWKYAYQIGSGWAGGPPGSTATNQVEYPGGANQGAVIVTDPESNDTVHLFALQNIAGISSEETSSTCGPYETATQYYQGSSEVIIPNHSLPQCIWGNKCFKEVDTTYSNTGTDYANPTNFSNYIPIGVFPSRVTTILSTGSGSLYSQDQYTYDAFGSYEDYTGETHPFSFGLALSSTESDFGGSGSPGAVLRSTLHTKQWQSNYAYYEANLIDLPCLDTVFSSTPTGTQKTCTPPTPPSNQVAQTSYYYDQSGHTASAGLGNLTSVARWLSGGPSNPTTYTAYTAYGMPSAKWDADGNETTFAYDSSNLFLNKITYKDTSFEVPQYDDTTGLLLSNIDVNGNPTGYTYDPMRRLLTVGYPDGGAETLTYVDTVGSLSVTFTKAINGGSSTVPALSNLGVSYSAATLTKVALADGLGRLTETELTDPNEASLGNRPIQVDTTYDLLGRVATVTNPYKRTNESTYGITTYTYDALGRKAIIKNSDNSIKQACFNGISTVGQFCQSNVPGAPAAWEDDTDENGNTWQRLQNGLGQMSYVYEPNGSSQTSTMETNYIYDVLGNLLHAYQYGQAGVDTQLDPRSFHYDTLSRLTSASNPESGTDTYTYDANGNVLSKTSPAINSGSGTQTLYYAYDCMNRLMSKWIGTAPSPPGCTSTAPTVTAALLDAYLYGLPGVGSNAVGRLINEHAYNNSTLVDKRTNIAYDSMGRLIFENQVPYSPTGTIYPFTYTYDLAGNPITASNGLVASNQQAPCTSTGTSDLCFNFAYDAADRLQIAAATSQPSAWTPAANYPPLLLQANPVTTTAFGSSVIDEPYDAMGHLANAQLSLATSSSHAQLKIARTYDDRGRITSELDGSYGKRTSATTSTGQIDIAGTDVATYASATVTFSGSEQSVTSGSTVTYDSGTLVVVIENGANTCSADANYGQGSTPSTLATALAASFNSGTCSATVSATASAANVTFTAKLLGSGGDYSLTYDGGHNNTLFPTFSFSTTTPAAMTGGGGAAYSSATFTFSGTEQSVTSGSTVTYDSGGLAVIIENGANTCSGSVSYGESSTAITLANALVTSINGGSCSNIVTATLSSAYAVTITAITPGANGNYALDYSGGHNTLFPTYSFSITTPAAMTGGVGDSGSIVITLSGGAITTPVSTVATLWSASLNATPGTLAASVVSAINTTTATSTYVTASLAADGTTILLNSTSAYSGTTANFNVAATVTDTAGLTPSYSAATTDMAGGLPAVTTAYGSIYSYLVPAGGYAPNGNLLAHDDSVTGPWAYTYDTLNRLKGSSSGAPSGAYYAGNTGCWTYDGFGNRTLEAFSNVNPTPCASDTNDQIYNSRTYVNNSYTNNRISNPNFAKYDSAGDTIADQENNYLYDVEGRLCATQSTVSGSPWYQYLYDAEGLRVGKAQITGTPTSCASPTSDGYGTGSTGQTEYLLDLAGEQITELLVSSAGVVTPQHSNLYIGSHLLATFDFTPAGSPSTHFPFTDPLGTKRMQVSVSGYIDLTCYSLPFGNNIPYSRTTYCPNASGQTAPDDTEQHFTGKERDTESGNDYFGARYYSSYMGRWMSPDKPFADQHPGDPQSWNLYMYGRNNALRNVDLTGQGAVGDVALGIVTGAALFVWHSNPIVENGVNTIINIGKLATAPNFRAELARQQAQEDAKSAALIDSVKKLGSAKGRQALANSIKDAWNGQTLYQKTQTVTQLSLGVATAVAGGWAGAAGGGAGAAEGVANALPATVVRAIPASIDATSLGAPGAADVFVTSGGALRGMTSSQISSALGIDESPSGFNLFEFATPEGIASPIGRMNPGFVGGGQTAGRLPEFVVPNGPIPAGATQTYVPPSN